MTNLSRQPRSPSPVVIRDAVIDDADRIGQIAVNAWQFAYASFLSPEFMATRNDPARRAQRTRERWDDSVVRLVALSGEGEVVGFAFEERPSTLAGFDAEIGALYVDPASSRNGAGVALVQAMVLRFTQNGAQSMAIHTLAQNEIGCSFYEKIGGQAGPYTTWNDIPSRWFVWPDLGTSFGQGA